MDFQQIIKTSTSEGRLTCPSSKIDGLLQSRFFWHERPPSFDVSGLLEDTRKIFDEPRGIVSDEEKIKGLRSISLNMDEAHRLLSEKSIKDLWFVRKAISSSVLAIGRQKKIDLFSLDRLMGGEDGVAQKVCLVRLGSCHAPIPLFDLNCADLSVAAIISHQYPIELVSGGRSFSVDKRPDTFGVVVGRALHDAASEVRWAKNAANYYAFIVHISV